MANDLLQLLIAHHITEDNVILKYFINSRVCFQEATVLAKLPFPVGAVTCQS